MLDRRAFLCSFVIGTFTTRSEARRPTQTALPDFSSLIQRVESAVVAIASGKQTVGSGYVDASGLVVTASHVVRAAAAPLLVRLGSQQAPAKIAAEDERDDIAVLTASSLHTSTTLPTSETAPQVGEWIVVLGNPFGAGITATAGIVSALPGSITASDTLVRRLQINASVNPGNSGGPVCNMRGEVIGIASSLTPGGQGLAFVTPAPVIRRLVQSSKSNPG